MILHFFTIATFWNLIHFLLFLQQIYWSTCTSSRRYFLESPGTLSAEEDWCASHQRTAVEPIRPLTKLPLSVLVVVFPFSFCNSSFSFLFVSFFFFYFYSSRFSLSFLFALFFFSFYSSRFSFIYSSCLLCLLFFFFVLDLFFHSLRFPFSFVPFSI